jgi:hypothetical protein
MTNKNSDGSLEKIKDYYKRVLRKLAILYNKTVTRK